MPSPLSIITGPTSGIGRYIALGLAQAGHDLFLVARDPVKADATRAWLRHEVPHATISVAIADLSLLSEARRVGDAIRGSGKTVQLLIHNAGVFSHRRRETSEGHELVIATNHLSPFVLTRTLLPCLVQSADSGNQARIVNIGSSTSDRARLYPDDLEGRIRWGLTHSYGQSKLALLMATQGWASRLQGSGVVANVVHPGAVATNLVRARGAIGLAWRLMRPFLLTEQQGAATPLHVALSPAFAAVTGAYIKRDRAVQPNRLASDAALADKLWAATEALTGP